MDYFNFLVIFQFPCFGSLVIHQFFSSGFPCAFACTEGRTTRKQQSIAVTYSTKPGGMINVQIYTKCYIMTIPYNNLIKSTEKYRTFQPTNSTFKRTICSPQSRSLLIEFLLSINTIYAIHGMGCKQYKCFYGSHLSPQHHVKSIIVNGTNSKLLRKILKSNNKHKIWKIMPKK